MKVNRNALHAMWRKQYRADRFHRWIWAVVFAVYFLIIGFLEVYWRQGGR